MTNEYKYDVFISYSRKDYVDENKNVIPGNIVSQITDALKENDISYWMDEKGIYSGDEFAKLIATYIRQSLVFLFVSTANSNESEWTSDEIATARMYKKKIIPFKYDDSFYNDEVIIFIAKLDFIDYESNPEHALTKLVASIKKYKADVEDAKKREIELREKKRREEEERKKRADEEAKKEKLREEIREQAKECQLLVLQQEVIVKQLCEKNVFVGNENKECPICKKIAPIEAPFCERCGFQFPALYAIDGNDAFSFDNRLLTIAKTNYDCLHSLGDENEQLKRLCAEQKESLNRVSEECEKHLEAIAKTKAEIEEKNSEIQELYELRVRVSDSQSKVEELEKEKQALADSIAKLEDELETMKSQANSAAERHPLNNGFGSFDGSIKGVFSVSPTKKVRFSKGNLQYQASTKIWRFADNQYDIIGENNKRVSANYDGWIDLFGWGTGVNPTKISQNTSDYFKYVDWGHNRISNGVDQANFWHTLTRDEWTFLFCERETVSGKRFAKAKVNNVKGILLMPDDWDDTGFQLNNINESNVSYINNDIDFSEWAALEKTGIVFLPAAGRRCGTRIDDCGVGGYYWSAPDEGGNAVFSMNFMYSRVGTKDSGNRCYGRSVRLVCTTLE